MIIDVIIPSLSKNQYSEKGDLASWGNTTLLEWKISQVKKVIGINDIYVATPDKEIVALCKTIGIKTIKRNKNIPNMYYEISKKLSKRYLMWVNCTSPFLSEKTLNKFIKNYKKNFKKFDSSITCFSEKEYFFFGSKSLNFNSKKPAVVRKKLIPLIKATNGACIISSDIMKKTRNVLGNKTFFFKVDWLSSLEIKESKDIDIYKTLFSYYLEK